MDLGRFLRRTVRSVGRQYGAAREAYTSGKRRASGEVPTDEDDRARIVCRRHAERRAVALDAADRPACYDPDHPDCRGCVEDIRQGRIETW